MFESVGVGVVSVEGEGEPTLSGASSKGVSGSTGMLAEVTVPVAETCTFECVVGLVLSGQVLTLEAFAGMAKYLQFRMTKTAIPAMKTKKIVLIIEGVDTIMVLGGFSK